MKSIRNILIFAGGCGCALPSSLRHKEKSFMLRLLLILILFFCACFTSSTLAQSAEQDARLKLWNSYQPPSADFARFVDKKQGYSLWRPAAWKESAGLGAAITFSAGEKGPQLRVYTAEVPDGYGAANFATAVLSQWRTQPIRQETIVARRVLVGGADGREFTFEIEEEPGHPLRETVWLTTVGPRAYIFYFFTEPEEQEKYEPYFKRMMLSLRIGAAGHWDEGFETLRARFATGASASQGRETEAAQFAETLRAGREPIDRVSERLTALMAQSPASALDLLTDYDPQVRASAIVAAGKTQDARMSEVLVWALADKDAYASALAARALAERGAAGLAALKMKLPSLSKEPSVILRVAALLPDEQARDLAQELLRSDESMSQLAGLHMALALPLKGLVLPFQKLLMSDSAEVFSATIAAIRLRHASADTAELLRLASGDAEYRAVRALGEIASADVGQRFAARVKEIDARMALMMGGQSRRPMMAIGRRGSSAAPPPPRPAVRNQPKVIITRNAPPPAATTEYSYDSEIASYREMASARWLPLSAFKALPENVRLAVLRGDLIEAGEKIDFRERYARAADKAARQAVYEEALRQPSLSGWAHRALRTSDATEASTEIDIKSLLEAPTTGETLFPQTSTLYLVAPNLDRTLAKLDEALSGVQMEGVRDQMTFALILKMLKTRLASAVGAEAASDAGAALGVDLKTPLSLGAWPADGDDNDAVSRSAVVLRVTDRARFERMLMLYENEIGGFDSFAVAVSAGARFMEVAPAFFPMVMARDFFLPGKSVWARGAGVRRGPAPVYVRRETWNGLSVTVFEKLSLYDSGGAEREAIYLAYLGSTAILAPTREALLDLVKAGPTRATIKDNKAYARTIAEEGEIQFFSQPSALLKESSSATKEQSDSMWQKFTAALGHETGALRLSTSSWETVFHLDLPDQELTRNIKPFKAQELSLPRDVLPASTIFYTGAKFEPTKLWSGLKGLGLLSARSPLNEPDIEKQLAPKLEGEVGMALLSLGPALDRDSYEQPAFLMALRLKDAELAGLHKSGRLFPKATVVAGVTVLGSTVVMLRDPSDPVYLAVTDDYLLIANGTDALKRLEVKEKFSATRDYSRSVAAAPESLVLFATYSLDAAFKNVQAGAKDESAQMMWTTISALTHAFHSQRAVVSLNGHLLEGKLAVSFDREGRFSVGDLAREAREFDVANALLTPTGLNIAEPMRTASLRLRVTAHQPGVIARVRDDVSKFPWQKIEAVNDSSLVFSVESRRIPEKLTVQLPVMSVEMSPYLRSSARIDTTAPQVIKLAREIAGNERDGRKLAHKLGEWTFSHLKWKRVESSNVETLASREADCLEHSELYVALARSLGLPARVVTGAAFSGGSFGAHAWVEIYLGRWVEVDPTWGMMDYVDSTHLRFDGDTFASYAMLNQLQLEVLEARNFIADYQRDPVRLIKEWGVAKDDDGTRQFVFDYALTASQALGPEVFHKLDGKQSAAVIQAFERTVSSEADGWWWAGQIRVLSSEVKDKSARLLVLRGDDLLRVDLSARDGAWFITEIEDTDYAVPMFADALGAALHPGTSRLQTLSFKPERAIKQLAQIASAEGESPQLLLLKALALRRKQSAAALEATVAAGDKEKAKEKSPPKESEANSLLKQIIARWPDFAAAHYTLGVDLLFYAEEPEKAIAPLRREAELMPLDPRPWTRMGEAFEQLKKPAEAESAYREAAARDRDNYESQTTLTALYFKQSQAEKARDSLAQAFKLTTETDAVFDSLSCDVLGIDVENDKAGHRRLEELLQGFPKELAGSRAGLRRLAHAQSEQEKYDAALQTLQRVLTLGAEADDYVRIAHTNRSARRFAPALTATDDAIKLESDNAGAYFERACALAQLGRLPEALTALKRALELDADESENLEDNDLKVLGQLPEFKKLLEANRSEDEGALSKPEPVTSGTPAP
jgi:transglutaminase-like putative cysteine protease/tetratricopeptide (TPR) repeat protein